MTTREPYTLEEAAERAKGKVYVGRRSQTAPGLPDEVVVEPEGKPTYPLPHIEWHSPTGFAWGYGGSGPADLALSILCDYFEEKPTTDQVRRGFFRAMPMYQAFKECFIATAPAGGFRIPAEVISAWLLLWFRPAPTP